MLLFICFVVILLILEVKCIYSKPRKGNTGYNGIM